MADLDVAYILLRFPCLTETFIAEEMRHIQRRGIRLHLYSLLRSPDVLVHPVSQELLSQAHDVPGVLSPSLWLAQLYYLLRVPQIYLGLLGEVLREPAPNLLFQAKRVVILLKGAWLARELQHSKVELVHIHFAWLPVVAALAIRQLAGIPFTATAHAYDIYSEKNDLLRLACRSAERIVTISEANQRAILALNPGMEAAKVTVLHCGVDLDSFQPPAVRPPHKTLEIMSVGSLISKKGHEYLIRACAELQAQRADFHCTIVGSGMLERHLKALIDELGLRGKVVLVGAQKQDWVRDRLCNSDLFVLPCVSNASKDGDLDGIPVAIMEAMAMNLPVISTAVSGIPELIRNEETGLLVAERNPKELSCAAFRVTADAHLRQRLVENGHRLVDDEYNISRNAGRLKGIFEQCIRSGGRAMGNTA